MISLSGAIYVLVYLCVAGLIFWLLSYALEAINPPEPFHKVARVVLIVLAVVVCIGILLSLLPGGSPIFRQ